MKVWASSPISVRLQRWTRCEKSPRARARLDCVSTLQRIGDAASRKDADHDAQQHGQKRQQAGGALHFVDAAIGFAARLLHDDGPVQRHDRAVGAEHLDVLGPAVDGEFLGLGELRLVAAIDKIAHDVEILHVLPGGKFGRGGGDQASLGVDDVGREAAAADFLQAADQKLKIDDRGDHAQKALSVTHRRTDQEYGAGGIAFAHDQGLTVVDAPIARGRIGSFEFTMQEGVRSDASGGDAFGVGIQQGRIGDLVGGRDEVFQQGAKFGSFDIFVADIPTARDLNGGRQVRQHHVQGALVLRQIVGQRPGHRILQQHLVGLQPVPIDGLDLGRIKIHRDDADDQEHAENDIQNRDARVVGGVGGQVSPFT